MAEPALPRAAEPGRNGPGGPERTEFARRAKGVAAVAAVGTWATVLIRAATHLFDSRAKTPARQDPCAPRPLRAKALARQDLVG